MKLKSYKRRPAYLLLYLFMLGGKALSQTPLDEYIREGLENNLVIQQKNISLEKSLMALKEAKSLFLPGINLSSGYTTGSGGRAIALPIGDLLNPVYSTLNQLTQSNAFPQVENIEQYYLPNNQFDLHVRTSVPVLNTDLLFNRNIQSRQVQLQETELDKYRRELVRDIQTAYYNYLMALTTSSIYESALRLVNKNVEVNESLLKNGKGLPAQVLRSQSELEQVQSQLAGAQNLADNARRYFNFLLNRDTNSPVDSTFVETEAMQTVLGGMDSIDISGREEIKMLTLGIDIFESQQKMHKHFWVPKLNAFADLGAQTQDWEFIKNSPYYLVGVQLDMPLFNRSNSLKVKKAALDVKMAETTLDLTTRQMRLSAEVARNDLATALRNYQSTAKQVQSAQSYFNLVERGYKEGINTLIEYLDARNQLTSSEVLHNIVQYRVLLAKANLERETASYIFNNTTN